MIGFRNGLSAMLPLILLFLSIASPKQAAGIGHPYLLKDIAPGSSSSILIYSGAPLNGNLIFSATDGINGTELWKTDGTPDGTQMIKDIAPGVIGSNPSNLMVFNNRVFFSANDGVNGTRLWSTDGTAGGTAMVVNDISAAGSGPSMLTAAGGQFFFLARTAATGKELWKSDGTSEGTVIVKDFTPGYLDTTFESLTPYEGQLIVVIQTGTSSWEMWKSDGTSTGTVLVRSFSVRKPQYLTACSGRVFFNCGYSTGGKELWVTDGTNSGTMQLKAIYPEYSSDPSNLTCVGTTLYFQASDSAHGAELWKSDGTADGTLMVADIKQGGAGSAPSNLTEFNGGITFAATAASTRSFWKSDGTVSGTSMIRDVGGGSPSLALNGKLFFSGSSEQGDEPWISDGTTEGTFMLGDIASGSSGSRPKGFWNAGNLLIFVADGMGYGNELWAVSLNPAPHSVIIAPVSLSATNAETISISGEAHSDTGSLVSRVEISTDGGNTWSPATGTSTWSFAWNPPLEGIYSVISRAVDEAGNVEVPGPAITVTVDRSAPTGSITINGGAETCSSRNVTLTIDADAVNPGLTCTTAHPRICGALQYHFSDNGVTWGFWQTAASTTSWQLPTGDGTKTVYMEIKDAAGNIASYSDTITLDSGLSPRSVITNPVSETITAQGAVTITGTATPGQGATLARVEVSTDGGGSWQTAAGTSDWSLSASLPEGSYRIKSRAIDSANTVEIPGQGVTYVVDQTPPTGGIYYNYNYDRYELNADATIPGGICPAFFPGLCGSLDMDLGDALWQPASIVLPYGTPDLWLRDKAGNTIFVSGVSTYGYPVKVEKSTPSFYDTLQQGCTSAGNGETIKLAATSFTESLTFGRGIAFTLSGGFNNTFSSATGYTAISGSILINGDDVSMQNVTVWGPVTVESGSVSADNVVLQGM